MVTPINTIFNQTRTINIYFFIWKQKMQKDKWAFLKAGMEYQAVPEGGEMQNPKFPSQ